jgi:hypothetical protein
MLRPMVTSQFSAEHAPARRRRPIRRAMHGIDQGAELVGKIADLRLAPPLACRAHQPLQQPGAVGVELLDPLHVDVDLADGLFRARGCAHERFELGGIVGCPGAAGHKLKPLAADLAGEQRHVHIPLRPVCLGRPEDVAYLTEPLGAFERSFTKR